VRLDQVEVGLGVVGEHVEGHERRQAEGADVGELAVEVLEPAPQVAVAVAAQRPQGGDEDDAARPEAREPHLEVEELLAPEVEAEAGLGDDDVGVAQGQVGGDDAGAAVGDVGEGPRVDEGGGALARLHQVRAQRLAQQHDHGVGGAEVVGGHRARRRRCGPRRCARAARAGRPARSTAPGSP
jgi:hypothetical protein